jgi:putative ABC transport system ATP-binding protein
VSSVIELTDVELTYPGPPPVPALLPMTTTIYRGDYVAIVGPSGSGKSTLLNVLGLLDRPTSGQYILDGHDTGSLSEGDRTALRARRIGFVFQAFHLLDHRTAMENVALAMLYTGVSTKERQLRAQEALDRVGLSHRREALPRTLSGGEKQRVAIARAIAGRPEILLCDEPTGNLDSASTAAVLELVDELRRDGLTVLIITHDAHVAAHGQRTLHIRDGQVTET